MEVAELAAAFSRVQKAAFGMELTFNSLAKIQNPGLQGFRNTLLVIPESALRLTA